MEAEAFLRMVLRARRDPAARAALPEVLPSLDWQAVIQCANSERITPLVYHTLKDQPLPPDVLDQMRDIYYDSARRNIVRFSQLENLLRVLAVEQIPVILLKGSALAEPVYGSVALRPMTDLDLLVAPRDFERAVAAAQDLGYQRTLGEAHTDTDMVEACVAQMVLPEMDGSYIEIHWDVLHPPYYQGRVDKDWLWQTARPVSVGRQPALLLSPEAGALHLCAHLCLHHFGQGLLWQNDVAELLARCADGFDWDLLLRKAVEVQLARALQIVLPSAAADFGAPVPPDVLRRLPALPVSSPERLTFQRMMDPHQSGASLTLNFLLGLPGWREKMRYALTSAFPSPAYMRQRYHISHPLLLPFYYPYRWITGLTRRS